MSSLNYWRPIERSTHNPLGEQIIKLIIINHGLMLQTLPQRCKWFRRLQSSCRWNRIPCPVWAIGIESFAEWSTNASTRRGNRPACRKSSGWSRCKRLRWRRRCEWSSDRTRWRWPFLRAANNCCRSCRREWKWRPKCWPREKWRGLGTPRISVWSSGSISGATVQQQQHRPLLITRVGCRSILCPRPFASRRKWDGNSRWNRTNQHLYFEY